MEKALFYEGNQTHVELWTNPPFKHIIVNNTNKNIAHKEEVMVEEGAAAGNSVGMSASAE